MQKLRRPDFGDCTLSEELTSRGMEACREQVAMETDKCKDQECGSGEHTRHMR